MQINTSQLMPSMASQSVLIVIVYRLPFNNRLNLIYPCNVFSQFLSQFHLRFRVRHVRINNIRVDLGQVRFVQITIVDSLCLRSIQRLRSHWILLFLIVVNLHFNIRARVIIIVEILRHLVIGTILGSLFLNVDFGCHELHYINVWLDSQIPIV
jgi:hypothetical protein